MQNLLKEQTASQRSSVFIRLCICLLAGLLLTTACAPKKRSSTYPKADLLILHTNDTHAHIAGLDSYGNACTDDTDCRGGLARIAYAIKDAKAQGANVLALDAGDMFTGTLFFSINKWPMQAELNKLMPYDAATLGNHEWDQGCTELGKYLASPHPFAFLAANLTPLKGCPLLSSDTEGFLIKEIGGQKVGVIGLANDEVAGLANACPETRFSDRVKTVETAVKALEAQGVKRIVLLTHLGLPADRKLARLVNGIDVIVGGHTHSYLGPGSKEGNYPIVETAPNGAPVLVVTAKCATQYLGELAVDFDHNGILTHWQGAARELAKTDPRDPEVSAKVAEYAKTLRRFTEHKLGSHNIDIGPDGLAACRREECLSALIMTDAMLDFGRPFGATLALHNSGGVRAALRPGVITQGDVLSAFPFGKKIMLRAFTGEQIWEALEHGVAGEEARGPQMLQTAGLKYVVDATKPVGKRVLSAELIDDKGLTHPLKPKKRYITVLPEYLVNGGDFFTMLTKGQRLKNAPEPKDCELLANYLQSHSPLARPVTGRLLHK